VEGDCGGNPIDCGGGRRPSPLPRRGDEHGIWEVNGEHEIWEVNGGKVVSSMEGECRWWKGITGAIELIAGAVPDVGMRPLMAATKALPPCGIGAEDVAGGRQNHAPPQCGRLHYLLKSSRDCNISMISQHFISTCSRNINS
jgi:hypothetical protein